MTRAFWTQAHLATPLIDPAVRYCVRVRPPDSRCLDNTEIRGGGPSGRAPSACTSSFCRTLSSAARQRLRRASAATGWSAAPASRRDHDPSVAQFRDGYLVLTAWVKVHVLEPQALHSHAQPPPMRPLAVDRVPILGKVLQARCRHGGQVLRNECIQRWRRLPCVRFVRSDCLHQRRPPLDHTPDLLPRGAATKVQQRHH